MPIDQVKKIVKKYGEILAREKYPFSSIYLFGSQVKGSARKDSDIDVAVISKVVMTERKRLLLWKARRDVDIRIEPHLIDSRDFLNNSDPLSYEIRKTGVRVI